MIALAVEVASVSEWCKDMIYATHLVGLSGLNKYIRSTTEWALETTEEEKLTTF
jgi:hypothetical protein